MYLAAISDGCCWIRCLTLGAIINLQAISLCLWDDTILPRVIPLTGSDFVASLWLALSVRLDDCFDPQRNAG